MFIQKLKLFVFSTHIKEFLLKKYVALLADRCHVLSVMQSLHLKFSFLNQISLLLVLSALFDNPHEAGMDPIIPSPQKILSYIRESHPEPLNLHA